MNAPRFGFGQTGDTLYVRESDYETLANDAAHLRRLLSHPACADDTRTLANLQAQRQRIVDAACAYADDPDTWGEAITVLLAACNEWRRLTAPTTEAA
jgi:hypothetical protein